ncbi:MAG: VTT domain-containing protein, partial [Burkholderiaceae bacterium]
MSGRLDASSRRRLWGLGLVLLLLLALSAAWRWSPLAEALRPEQLVPLLRELAGRLGLAACIAVLTLALVLAVPLVLLTLVGMLALGPLWGSVAIVAAALAAAALNFGLGRVLGHALLQRLAGPRLQRLSRQLERHGLWAVIGLRLVPV